jgi:transcriptional regulator with XRE-family HTH domain
MAGKKQSEGAAKPAVELDRSFGPNLRRRRKQKGYSQEELAERAEVHRTEVGLLERGERDPGFNVIVKLAGALGIAPGELFVGTAFVPATDAGPQGHFAYDLPDQG